MTRVCRQLIITGFEGVKAESTLLCFGTQRWPGGVDDALRGAHTEPLLQL